MPLLRRITTAGAALALFTSITVAATSTPTSAATACGNSVVVSVPLKNTATGQASWDFGYVQLWYDSCSGNNWARVVSLRPETGWEMTGVYNAKNAFNGLKCAATPILTSGTIHSPADNAGAWARVFANGDEVYEAEANQAGVSASRNMPEWAMCAP
ncbi:hypothetical protein ACFWJ4_23360 [Kitasatospora sp. NPDC127067]|uniref:hypothetical protein n=1 Tax=Kitasatospora sp. NPDC127067 TaxID=3347126 RepID=UPI0036683DF2